MQSLECWGYKVNEMDKLPDFMVLKSYVEIGVREISEK